MAINFDQASELLRSARTYVDVFGGDSATDATALKRRYREVMRVVHPDRVAAHQRDSANELVVLLGRLYETAKDAYQTGSYGHVKPLATFTSQMATHEATAELATYCDISTMYQATSVFSGGESYETLLKVSRTPRDNDLFEQETRALRLLGTTDSKHVMFYPHLRDAFGVRDGKRRLKVNVIDELDGFINLEQVRRLRPAGLHLLDAAWIWRRMLWALDGAHKAGVVHGAVLPRHIIIHPVLHSVVLVDWCYSVSSYDHGQFGSLRAVVGDKRSWYPTSVFEKKPVTPGLDLSMAARTMVYLLGGDPVSMTMSGEVPVLAQRHLHRIGAGQEKSAIELLEQFDDLLQTLGAPYYPRAYRELKLS